MKLASSEARNSAALATSQQGAHLAAQRHPSVALRGDFDSAAVAGPHPGVDRHRRVDQPGKMQLARMP
jgi:hypothetical protein